MKTEPKKKSNLDVNLIPIDDKVIEKQPKTITLIKRGPLETDSKSSTFKSIDAALQALRGDVWVSELLLVITPEKETMDSSTVFEVHGIDKIYKQYLGTIYMSRAELRNFEEDGKFDNYSIVFVNTPIDTKTCLEFLVGQYEESNKGSIASGRSGMPRRKRTNQGSLLVKESEPTFHELLLRLERNCSNTSDLKKFFDFSEKYNFSIIIRPDFVKFSNKLILDFFIFSNHYVGSLTLSNKDITDQIGSHRKLVDNLVIVEDTNELLIPKKVATFIRRMASFLNLLYVYDYMSEFIYKIHHNI